MATTPNPVPRRHALGMPAGSVRALLGLAVLGLLWALALTHPHKLPLSFIYLQFLMLLILAHYFAAHGKSIGRELGGRSALGLPRGSLRFLLLGGYLGLAVYLYQHNSAFELPPSGPFFFLVALLLTGFFAGYLMTGLVAALHRGTLPGWVQDFQAWVALLGVVGLTVLVLVYAIINPSLAQETPLNLDHFQAGLAAVVGFYFGARS